MPRLDPHIWNSEPPSGRVGCKDSGAYDVDLKGIPRVRLKRHRQVPRAVEGVIHFLDFRYTHISQAISEFHDLYFVQKTTHRSDVRLSYMRHKIDID